MTSLLGFLMTIFLQKLQDIVDFIVGLIPVKAPSLNTVLETKIIAHRGWCLQKKVKENTFAAFDPCLTEEIFGIEFDIRWTRDLVPIVHHDANLERVFGKKEFIKDIDFKSLREACPEIPSLEEVVTRYGKKIHLLIELKKEHFLNLDKQRGILKNILGPLEQVKDYHLLSLSPEVFEKFNIFKKEAMVIVSTINPRQMSGVVVSEGYGGLMGHYVLMSNRLLKRHEKIKLGTGFPKNKNSFFKEMNRDSIDWIFTNHPEVFLKYRKMRIARGY